MRGKPTQPDVAGTPEMPRSATRAAAILGSSDAQEATQAAAQRLRETLVRCIAELEDDCQLDLTRVESLAGRLQRAGAEGRKADAERERVKDEFSGVTKAVGRALGVLDGSAASAELDRPGLGNGAAAGSRFDASAILRETIERASRRIGTLCDELGELQLSRDVAKSQLRVLQQEQPMPLGELAQRVHVGGGMAAAMHRDDGARAWLHRHRGDSAKPVPLYPICNPASRGVGVARLSERWSNGSGQPGARISRRGANTTP